MMLFSNRGDSINERLLHAKSFVETDIGAVAMSSSVYRDVEHSCRALAPIEDWVASHQLENAHRIKFRF